jgi:hypothetical protein
MDSGTLENRATTVPTDLPTATPRRRFGLLGAAFAGLLAARLGHDTAAAATHPVRRVQHRKDQKRQKHRQSDASNRSNSGDSRTVSVVVANTQQLGFEDFVTCRADCPPGHTLVGGGFTPELIGGAEVREAIPTPQPNPTSFVVTFHRVGNELLFQQVTAYAICLPVS